MSFTFWRSLPLFWQGDSSRRVGVIRYLAV